MSSQMNASMSSQINGSRSPSASAESVPAGTLRIVGIPGSPYSRKVLSVLRFRRISYRWITRWSLDDEGLQDAAGPPLLPNVIFDDGESVADSTPIIKRLELQFPDRKVHPSHAGLAFLNSLLEDYADEWHSKHMFHYRWWFKPDIIKGGRMLPMGHSHTMPDAKYRGFEKLVIERQTQRVVAVTGSNEITAPVIEESYKCLISVLNDHFSSGTRFFSEIGPHLLTLRCSANLHSWHFLIRRLGI
ncbi:unnamed protein product [Polarella glacialis]|uniref:GST N-terminal domain-containing protein n=1 Tax=Polarella glacialis TaxID=89957 RepID=A0A813I909_POLGL|nr:unnamed protein product [Polarella glacialis]